MYFSLSVHPENFIFCTGKYFFCTLLFTIVLYVLSLTKTYYLVNEIFYKLEYKTSC